LRLYLSSPRPGTIGGHLTCTPDPCELFPGHTGLAWNPAIPHYALWEALTWRHRPPCAACIVIPPAAGALPRTINPRQISAASQGRPNPRGSIGIQLSRRALLLPQPAPPSARDRTCPAYVSGKLSWHPTMPAATAATSTRKPEEACAALTLPPLALPASLAVGIVPTNESELRWVMTLLFWEFAVC
jgi:hypothetical protein